MNQNTDHKELERRCTKCNGEGLIYSERWQYWWKKHEKDWREAINGPDVPDVPEAKSCSECEGVGAIPTDEGNLLLFFLARHWDNFRSKTEA